MERLSDFDYKISTFFDALDITRLFHFIFIEPISVDPMGITVEFA
jgi:hypothetical protein